MSTTILEREPGHDVVGETGTFTDEAAPSDAPPSETVQGETCTHCHNTESFGLSEWCPKCGYHPRFKRVFDMDAGSWDDGPADFSKLVPPWARVLVLGMLGIVVLGVVVRLQFSVPHRAVWTLSQVLLGLLVFGAGHIAAYTHAAAESDKVGPFDMLFQPFAIWKPTLRDLPANAWRTWLGSWGMTAGIVALAVVGGIDWLGIFDADWGVKKAAQGNLVHHIVDKARKEKGEGAESLEDAMKDFAGEEKPEEKPKKKPTVKADCLLIGYTLGTKGTVAELLFASVRKKKLQYVGQFVFADLPPEVRAELDRVLPLLKRGTPFVDCKVSGANWVHPVKVLRFDVEGWTSTNRIKAPAFDEVLEDLRLQ
jgi:hypothetical protein